MKDYIVQFSVQGRVVTTITVQAQDKQEAVEIASKGFKIDVKSE